MTGCPNTMHHCIVQGWSAVSCQDIAEGWFVAQYAGEIISSREAEIRLQAYDDDLQAVGHALLVRVACELHVSE